MNNKEILEPNPTFSGQQNETKTAAKSGDNSKSVMKSAVKPKSERKTLKHSRIAIFSRCAQGNALPKTDPVPQQGTAGIMQNDRLLSNTNRVIASTDSTLTNVGTLDAGFSASSYAKFSSHSSQSLNDRKLQLPHMKQSDTSILLLRNRPDEDNLSLFLRDLDDTVEDCVKNYAIDKCVGDLPSEYAISSRSDTPSLSSKSSSRYPPSVCSTSGTPSLAPQSSPTSQPDTYYDNMIAVLLAKMDNLETTFLSLRAEVESLKRNTHRPRRG